MTLALHHSSQINRNDFSTISALDLYHAIYCGKIIKQPLIITIRGRAMYVDPFCFQTNPFFQLLSQFTYYVGAPCKSERLFLFTIHNISEHLFVVNSFSEEQFYFDIYFPLNFFKELYKLSCNVSHFFP